VVSKKTRSRPLKRLLLVVGWQASGEALTLELPRSRLLAGLRTEVLPHVSLAMECCHDEDYAAEDGGSGGSADAVIGRLIFAMSSSNE